MTLELEWGGTEKELIDFSDACAKEDSGEAFGLDSPDIGDAMGYWITECMLGTGEVSRYDGKSKNMLSAVISYDSFSWEGLKK